MTVRSGPPRNPGSLEALRAEVADLRTVVAETREAVMDLHARLGCIRCTTPGPPPPRWPGDVWSRDQRPSHTCGRTGR
jgi:hypothetical protein